MEVREGMGPGETETERKTERGKREHTTLCGCINSLIKRHTVTLSILKLKCKPTEA